MQNEREKSLPLGVSMKIDKELKTAAPDLALGIIIADVKVTRKNAAVWEMIQETAQEAKKS